MYYYLTQYTSNCQLINKKNFISKMQRDVQNPFLAVYYTSF